MFLRFLLGVETTGFREGGRDEGDCGDGMAVQSISIKSVLRRFYRVSPGRM